MEPSGTVEPSVNLIVKRVRTSEALSRAQIMIQASPTKIEYYATDQWAGTLSELVEQKLTAEFGPPVEGRRTLDLVVMVLSCEQVDVVGGAEARMKLAVTMTDRAGDRSGQPLFEKTYDASSPASHPSAEAVVQSLSVCAEEIAAKIATDASSI